MGSPMIGNKITRLQLRDIGTKVDGRTCLMVRLTPDDARALFAEAESGRALYVTIEHVEGMALIPIEFEAAP